MASSSTKMLSLDQRKKLAIAAIPQPHLSPPTTGEVVNSEDSGRLRCQDYAFTQGFAIVVTSHEIKRRTCTVLKCQRHGNKTRNTHRLTEQTRQRHNTKTSFLNCPYKVRIMWYKAAHEWRLSVVHSEHNHEMLDNPFELEEHYLRDPLRDASYTYAKGLKNAGQPFHQAKKALKAQGLRLTPKEYYNLKRAGRKRTKEEEVQFALKTLEEMGYHVRVKEKYMVDNNIRQSQQIEHFFFCSPIQIMLARQFAGNFVVITDATFNTNENNLPLSVLVCVTNTLRTFPIAYCYITSESAEAFTFMNTCMKELFFYGNCRGMAVLLGDFAAGLTTAMLTKRKISLSEAGLEIAWELTADVDDLGSEVFLQLCSWHAAEAIKARLTREGYPAEDRKELHHKVWKWIKSSTMDKVAINRQSLLDDLHSKDQAYIWNFYQRQEHQFITAYTKTLPNCGCSTSQRGESIHPAIKKFTNRHTPIGTSVVKIAEKVDDMQETYFLEINRQKKNLPRCIDHSREVFAQIMTLITHQAIELIVREWNAAQKWFFAVENKAAEPPQQEGCSLGCESPKRYKLPCKCWLYRNVVTGERIPLSLIHPRWLFDAPQVVIRWEMTFNSSVTMADYQAMTGSEDTSDSSDNNIDKLQEIPTAIAVTGNRFDRRGLTLLESTSLQTYDFHQQITEAHRREEYAREHAKLTAALNKRFEQKYQDPLPVAFSEAKKPEHIEFPKGGSRRRAYTGREAAEAAENDKRRRNRVEEMEHRKHVLHSQRMEYDRQETRGDADEKNLTPFFSVSDSDSDIQIVATQPAQGDGEVSPDEKQPVVVSSGDTTPENKKRKEKEEDNFLDIDDFFPPSPPSPPPLVALHERRSQQVTLSQLPPSTASVTTRGSRKVATKKARKVLDMESQQRHRAEDMAKKAAKKDTAEKIKQKKLMEPRKEDVSQVADQLLGPSL